MHRRHYILGALVLQMLWGPPCLDALRVEWDWSMSGADNCMAAWKTGAIKAREARITDKDPFLQYSGFNQKGVMKQRDVMLIHVGKTGGSSVSWSIRSNGIKLNEIHVHPVLPGMIERHKLVIITVRDPSDRYVSAFNYNHPLGAHPAESPIYDCYPNISAASTALFDEDACGDSLRCGLDGVDLHTDMGYCYYLGGVRATLSRHPNLHVVNTSTAVNDTMSLLKKMGYQLKKRYNSKNLHVYMNSTQHTILSSELGARAACTLKKFLSSTGEYGLYDDILKLVNNKPSTIVS